MLMGSRNNGVVLLLSQAMYFQVGLLRNAIILHVLGNLSLSVVIFCGHIKDFA